MMKARYFVFLLLLTSFSAFSQEKFKPYIGVHASMDAGGYYVGPSFMAGTDYQLKQGYSLSSYFHLFHDRLYDVYPDGSIDKGNYQSYILALLLEKHLSHKPKRGMQVAGGIAVQRTIEDYISYNVPGYEKRTILVAALRLGYRFPFKHRSFTVELNAVGPHIGKVGPPPYYPQTIEILTQLSLGTRFLF